jgi:glc operon protein GlcG
MSRKVVLVSILALFAFVSTTLVAQAPTQYGAPISIENAKKVAAAAIAEAKKNNWTMCIAIVDPGGNLVYLEKMDGTQTGSVSVSIDKARSAALFKRPGKAFQDTLAAGGDGLRLLQLQGAIPIDGSFPLIMEGKIVGAIGASGGTSDQDGVAGKAGAAAVK